MRHGFAALLALLAAVPQASAAVRTSYVTLPAEAERGSAIAVRVTAPEGSKRLPVILFSHGATYSGNDYRALADYWAEHGFAVLQPTHLDAAILGLPKDDPRRARIWRLRRDDMVTVLDQIDDIAAQVPGLRGRLDARRTVAIGHSYGALVTELLLGATTLDERSVQRDNLSDPRLTGGILLSAPGGADNATPAVQALPYMHVDWSTMRKPALVVIGDLDRSPMSTMGPGWHEDPYRRAPAGAICLLALRHAGHFLGGIGGGQLEAAEPHDERAIALVQRTTLAWAKALVARRRTARLDTVVPRRSDDGAISQAHCRMSAARS